MLPCAVGSLLVTEPLVWGDMLAKDSSFYTKVVYSQFVRYKTFTHRWTVSLL